MSITLLTLAVAVIGEALRQNPHILQESQVGIRELAKQAGDMESGNDYRKNGWTIMEDGNMFRTYHFPFGKSAAGLSQAVFNFFRNNYKGTKVTLSNKSGVNGTVITCVPDVKNVNGLARKTTGTDIKLTVVVSKSGQDVSVSYSKEIDDELIRATKALFSNPVVGICKLYGINERHQVPFELSTAIKEYLDS